jgi:multiple sugar transport system substrate-binding protein
MKVLKSAFLSSLAVLLLIGIMSCTFVLLVPTASGAKESVKIDIWYRWGGLHHELMLEILKNFGAKYPEISVEPVSVAGRLWEELEAKVLAKLAAGEEPPSVMVPGYYLVEHCVKTFNAVRLDEVGGAKAPTVFDNYLPAVLSLAQVKGVQYGLPFALSNPVLFYNTDIFKKAGLDPKNPPRTWREMKLMGKIIRDKTNIAPLYMNAWDSWYMQALIECNGGHFLQEGRATLNSPEAIGAMETWREFYEGGIIPKITYREAMEAFQAGKMAMQGNSITLFQGFAQKVGVSLETAKVPTFDGKPRRLPPGGGPLVILARKPEKRKAAWELTKYMVSQEAMSIWIRTGYISPLDPAKVKIESDRRQNPAYEQLQYMVPWVNWPGPNSLEIEKVICDWRDKILYGEVDVKKGLNELQEAVTALLP